VGRTAPVRLALILDAEVDHLLASVI
jgi:hypothetical protein